VVHLELRISPQIFEKIRNGPIGILRGLGETDSWKKNRSRKSRGTVPLKLQQWGRYTPPISSLPYLYSVHSQGVDQFITLSKIFAGIARKCGC
jgi:hypothetical protein